jgi:hypothetical protein
VLTKIFRKVDLNIEMNTFDPELIFLKAQITIARKKLNQVWSERGKTDSVVLAVGNELDRLINEYERKKNSEQ